MYVNSIVEIERTALNRLVRYRSRRARNSKSYVFVSVGRHYRQRKFRRHDFSLARVSTRAVWHGENRFSRRSSPRENTKFVRPCWKLGEHGHGVRREQLFSVSGSRAHGYGLSPRRWFLAFDAIIVNNFPSSSSGFGPAAPNWAHFLEGKLRCHFPANIPIACYARVFST